jgi:8-oxo-dGTP pyrophosphatase MutT (NUDIX family)
MDQDESPETCAIRELKEETGYIGKLVSDRSFQVSPIMFNGETAFIDCFDQFLYCATIVYIVLEFFVVAFSSAVYYVSSYHIRRLLEVNIQIDSFKPLTGAELVALRTYMYHNFKGDQRVVRMIVDSFEITNTSSSSFSKASTL